MRSSPHILRALVVLLALWTSSLGSPGQAYSQDRRLTPAEALRLASINSPRLREAVLDLRLRGLTIDAAGSLYTPTLTADLGYQLDRRPRVVDGESTVNARNGLTTSVGISQTFETGTSIGAALAFDWWLDDAVVPGEPETGIGVDLILEARQPWLRGFGDDIGAAQRELALREAEIARLERDRVASALARDVLVAYWERWYAERSVSIEQASLEVAERELEDAAARLEVGAIAESDLLPLRTELASRRESVASARLSVRRRGAVLQSLLAADAGESVVEGDLDATAPPLAEAPPVSAALSQAASYDPQLRQLDVELDAAVIRATVADDSAEMRLDTVAWARVSGLGDSVGEAFAQFGVFEATSFFVGLEIEIPLDNTVRRSEADTAHYALETAALRQAQARVALEAEVVDLVTGVDEAWTRHELARETAALAADTTELWRDRFEQGDATALDVVQALQIQREAELRVVRAQVDLAIGQARLDDRTGALLAQVPEI